MQERWVRLDPYDYEISEEGEIRHIKHLRIRKPTVSSSGYERIRLRNKDTKNRDTLFVHRLVAGAFLNIPFLGSLNGRVVDHINRVRLDNRLENLRIISHSDNRKNSTGLPNLEIIEKVITLNSLGFTAKEILLALA